VSYEWTATGDWSSISTGSSSGTGDFPGFTAKANTSGVGYVATITVKPKTGNCYGAQKSFTLTVNPKPALSVDATPVSCYGGSDGEIELTASGGTPSYEYKLGSGSYQPGKTFTVSAGTHTVTVKDAKGCEETTQIVVTQPPAALDASPGVTNILCHGGDGEIKITATGGTSPYKYSIDGGSYQSGNTFTVKAGTYSVTVEDANGCTKTLSGIAVTQESAMDISHTVTNVSCNGGSDGTITITASGGISPYEYKLGSGSYQPGKTFTVPAGTNYTVTVKDYNGCEKILTLIAVTQPPALDTTSTVITSASCSGAADGTIKINATGGAVPYQYSLNGGSYQSANTFSAVVAGTHSVTVKDANDCTATFGNLTVAEQPVLLTPPDVSASAVCSGQPAIITIANTRTGVLYDAYDASSGGTKKGSGAGVNGTAIDVNAGVISASTIFYVEAVEGTCISSPRVPVTVSIDKNAVNYPDIVVRVCPSVSAVNLSKYLDTAGLPAVVWKGLSINSSTGETGAIPSHGVYTYKYSVTGCESTPLQRIVYLHVVSNDKSLFLRDTVAVCWEQAEALQINQMFGIEAPGVWTTIPDLMTSAYIRQTPVGAVIFNGTAAYKYAAGAESLPIITYQNEPAKIIEFYYTVPAGCLTKKYKVVIVLTPKL
jgi:hypothetical protein